jgi:hypothetical protein
MLLEKRFEGFTGGRHLRVRCRVVDRLDELLVRRELLIDRSLGVVELLLRVVLTAEHAKRPSLSVAGDRPSLRQTDSAEIDRRFRVP